MTFKLTDPLFKNSSPTCSNQNFVVLNQNFENLQENLENYFLLQFMIKILFDGEKIFKNCTFKFEEPLFKNHIHKFSF